jgi:outer membrane lipoprotein-sorting protein
VAEAGASRPGWWRRQLLQAAAAGLLATAGAQALAAGASGFDLDHLMALLATRSGGEARFTEERTVASLDTPLRSSGRLSFAAPDRFARHTEEPSAESMEVQGNSVVLRRGTRTRRMNLDTVPELAALTDALRGTLSGNAALLQRHFGVAVRGNAGRWVLALTPRDAKLAGSLTGIEVTGSGPDVRSIEMNMAGGDRSLMLVEPLRPNRP